MRDRSGAYRYRKRHTGIEREHTGTIKITPRYEDTAEWSRRFTHRIKLQEKKLNFSEKYFAHNHLTLTVFFAALRFSS